MILIIPGNYNYSGKNIIGNLIGKFRFSSLFVKEYIKKMEKIRAIIVSKIEVEIFITRSFWIKIKKLYCNVFDNTSLL